MKKASPALFWGCRQNRPSKNPALCFSATPVLARAASTSARPARLLQHTLYRRTFQEPCARFARPHFFRTVLTRGNGRVIIQTDRRFVLSGGSRMARNKYPEETIQKILDTAEQLFIEKGYDHASLQDIIETTGLSKGAIYHHFASKEDMFYAVCDRIERCV